MDISKSHPLIEYGQTERPPDWESENLSNCAKLGKSVLYGPETPKGWFREHCLGVKQHGWEPWLCHLLCELDKLFNLSATQFPHL